MPFIKWRRTIEKAKEKEENKHYGVIFLDASHVWHRVRFFLINSNQKYE